MFLCGGKDEDGVRGRLLKGLEQGIESALREHVNLVDDINRVLAYLRRDTHLVDERADIVHRVVRRRV